MIQLGTGNIIIRITDKELFTYRIVYSTVLLNKQDFTRFAWKFSVCSSFTGKRYCSVSCYVT